jgi:hypothetical protein
MHRNSIHSDAKPTLEHLAISAAAVQADASLNVLQTTLNCKSFARAHEEFERVSALDPGRAAANLM